MKEKQRIIYIVVDEYSQIMLISILITNLYVKIIYLCIQNGSFTEMENEFVSYP